jgi:ATP-dependent helicase/DNAse subunit B
VQGENGQRVSPAAIGILARELDSYQQALREVCAEYGLPLFVSRGEPLGRRPVARVLMALLDLIASDFPRAATIAVWDSTYLALDRLVSPAATAGEADDISRRAGILKGRAAWLQALDRLAERTRRRLQHLHTQDASAADADDEAGDGADSQELLALLETVKRVRTTFAALAAALEPLMRPAPRRAFIAHLLALLDRLEISHRLLNGSAERHQAAELTAWNALVDALQAIADVDELAGGGEIAPPVFAAEVRELLSGLRLAPQGRGEGCLLALDVHDALQTSFDYVFVLGLSEGLFPLRHSPDPLLPDECRAALEKTGLPLRPRQAAQEEEAYLFHLALSTARRRIYLCYPDTDAQGEPLLRSYYVDEALRLLPQLPARYLRLRDVLPPLPEATSAREMAERCFWLEWEGGRDPDASDRALRPAALQALASHDVYGQALETAQQAARVERLRAGRLPGHPAPPATFGPFDAVLESDPAARAELEKLFGATHVFSASQLNVFGFCPMAFFFEFLLQLRPLEEPAEEVAARDMGLVEHQALRAFYQARRDQKPAHVANADRQAARQLLAECLDKVLQQLELEGLIGHEALWPVTRDLVRRRLDIWLAAEAQIPDQLLVERDLAAGRELVPTFFEYRYDPPSGTALELELPTAGRVRFSGIIDRVDELGADAFVVYDYKHGSAPDLQDLREGRDFQLPLYALAAQQVLYRHQRRCWAWSYVRVGQPVDDALKGTAVGFAHVQELLETAKAFADAHIAALRQGWFAWPSKCLRGRWCPYRHICRFELRRARRRHRARGGSS